MSRELLILEINGHEAFASSIVMDELDRLRTRLAESDAYAIQCRELLRRVLADLDGPDSDVSYAVEDEIREALAKNPSQSTTERSASAQFGRESGGVRTRGVATPGMHEGPANFQRTPHGSEGSASPLLPSDANPGSAVTEHIPPNDRS